MMISESIVPALLIVVTILVKGIIPTSDTSRNDVSSEKLSCISVEAVPLCADLGYVNTTFPNLRGHATAKEANEELSHFLALVSTGCSNAIVHLLCSIYAPMCIQEFSELRYPPCKNLCEYVEEGCAETLMLVFGYYWPPGPHLDCYNYDTAEDNRLCFGPSDPSILEIPFHIKYPDPPQNLTATLLSPSTVKFTWETTETDANEVFILTCDPQPYEFPLSTTGTALKAPYFTPDTSYFCSVFTAHTLDIKNSTATVQFRTPKMQPPRNFVAKHISPDCVQLSWDHPDSELPKIQRENLLYFVSCHSQNSDFQKSAKGENITLSDLQADTEYTCRVALTQSFPVNRTALITFTTLEPLAIQFVNNTPNIENNTVRLEFQINRPASKITCRISEHTEKEDCSNFRITFQNIPAGSHTLRIIAQNNKKDKLTSKTKIYISGTDPSSCAINLINNRITYMDNSVLIYFSGTNSVDRFRCSLNKQTPFQCNPPLFLRSLDERRHQVKITPDSDWCENKTPLVVQFDI